MPLWLLAVAPAIVLGASWLRWRSSEIDAQEREARRALADGELARAAAIFQALMQRRRSIWWALELARLAALRGDLDGAARWTGDARARLARERSVNRTTAAARLLLVDVLSTTRRGQLDDAWRALAQQWATFEQTQGGWLFEASLLRGFLAWKAGASVEHWLGLDEAQRAQARWMAAEWPELRAFLDAHDAT
jgi:hypothetical protein